jgi:hypothetical protein
VPNYTARKIEAYRLDSIVDDQAADYAALFRYIADARPPMRVLEKSGKLVAIPELSISGTRVSLIAFEGARGMHPLIFDVASAASFVQGLAANEIVATKTHAIIDFGRREAVIEFNSRGARSSDIARVLENSARHRSGWEELTIELSEPCRDEEFHRGH